MMENRASYSGSGARSAIFAAIRTSLDTSWPFDAGWHEHHGHSADAEENHRMIPPVLPLDNLIVNFQTNLEAVGGSFTLAGSRKAASDTITKIIANLAAERISISDSPLVKSLMPAGGDLDVTENASAEYLFESDLGVTEAQWAIAETGTLVLESDVENHRLTSLVPPVHICVLRAGNLRQTLGEILELTSRNLSRTVTFITGASRTSDIELTLAIGVHGPGELHVIVIADEA